MSTIVQTVLGDINSEQLGRTLTHEHLSMELQHFYRKPLTRMSKINILDYSQIGYVKQYPYSCKYNLVLNDINGRNAVTTDVTTYKEVGGGAIVENSTLGLERNLKFCKDVSKQTGVHVIAGTGYYIADTQPVDYLITSKEDMYNHMLKELTEGCIHENDDIIKAGFIGEIASVWPLRHSEIKAIKAAGEVQEKVGCGVSFHPHHVSEAPFEIIRLYLEAGGAADKAVMSHLDLLENEKLKEFSELGTYCQFGLFGTEVSYYQLNDEIDMPSDAQRIDMIRQLVNAGKESRVLMSHDIHTKHRLTTYGGHGYSHIIESVIPKMQIKGFSQSTIDKITIENPAKWLEMKT